MKCLAASLRDGGVRGRRRALRDAYGCVSSDSASDARVCQSLNWMMEVERSSKIDMRNCKGSAALQNLKVRMVGGEQIAMLGIITIRTAIQGGE